MRSERASRRRPPIERKGKDTAGERARERQRETNSPFFRRSKRCCFKRNTPIAPDEKVIERCPAACSSPRLLIFPRAPLAVPVEVRPFRAAPTPAPLAAGQSERVPLVGGSGSRCRAKKANSFHARLAATSNGPSAGEERHLRREGAAESETGENRLGPLSNRAPIRTANNNSNEDVARRAFHPSTGRKEGPICAVIARPRAHLFGRAKSGAIQWAPHHLAARISRRTCRTDRWKRRAKISARFDAAATQRLRNSDKVGAIARPLKYRRGSSGRRAIDTFRRNRGARLIVPRRPAEWGEESRGPAHNGRHGESNRRKNLGPLSTGRQMRPATQWQDDSSESKVRRSVN